MAWNGLPLIAADLVRLQQIRPMAEKVARLSGLPVRLVRFTTRTEIDVIRPVDLSLQVPSGDIEDIWNSPRVGNSGAVLRTWEDWP